MNVRRWLRSKLSGGLLLLLPMLVTVWLLLPATGLPGRNRKLPHVKSSMDAAQNRGKDAAFDKQALKAADPSRDKALLVVPRDSGAVSGTSDQRRRRRPLIPHILHQTWDTHDVPRTFVPWIKSWLNNHPHWEYWLWTPRAVHCLLDKHYPSYTVLYDEYPDDISRADVMRYFVLHQFGGIYVDLDTTSLKPLDLWTYSHQCLVSEEPYEHVYLVRQMNHSNIVNSPLAARPRHPFFAEVIKQLPHYAGRYFGDFLHSTGPYFLDAVYQTYIKSIINQHDNITVVPPKYFLPTYDPSQTGIIDDKCNVRTYKDLPPNQRQVCTNVIDRDYRNVPYPDSFMDHYWVHVNTFDSTWKAKDTVSIADIVPKVKKMSLIVCT